MEKKLLNLVLVAVFWSSQEWVASELAAREYQEQNISKLWTATYVSHSALLDF